MNPSRDRIFLVLALLGVSALLAQAARHSPEFLSMDRKIAQIEANANQPQPKAVTTELLQQELNAYFREGGVPLAKGLSDPKFALAPGAVTATATVDFDQLAASQNGINPIFAALFTGTHDLEVQANAFGRNGQGTVNVQSVKLDGMPVPRAALDYLIQRYVKPRYPSAGMTTTFALPDRIQTAEVQQGRVQLTQQ